MSFHKTVKFPFEVTKGKSRDLFRLKFLRKSELQPNVRHNLRHANIQTGRQLDIWYKEQLFVIGALTKDQEKIYQSRKRLRKEQRQIKRHDYARQQEVIREKLQGFRVRMIMMKVVQKFKDNVQKNKDYRMKETTNKGKVDFLRVPGNKHPAPPKDDNPMRSNKEEITKETKLSKKKQKKSTTKNVDVKHKNGEHGNRESNGIDSNVDNSKTHKKSRQPKTNENDISNVNIYNKSVDESEKRKIEQDLQDAIDYDSGDNTGDSPRDGDTEDASQTYVQRYPSSHGPRMETIPEEITEEVELEIDYEKDDNKTLTRRRLMLLNRSHAQRNIFDTDENVPLLPDVTSGYTSFSHKKPDTTDKETQTSNDSKERSKDKKRNRKKSATDDTVKKTLVVKLPRSAKTPKSPKSPRSRKSQNSIESNSGNYGSGDETENAETDIPLYYGLDGSDSDISETDGWDSGSADDSDVTSSDGFFPGEVSLTLTKYESQPKVKRVTSDNEYHKETSKFKKVTAHLHNFPDETDLAEIPSLQTLHGQNPYSLQYKERSFFLNSDYVGDRLLGSARTERSKHDVDSEYYQKENGGISKTELEHLSDIKNKRLDDIRKQMARDYQMTNVSQSMAVFGTKADNKSKKAPTPPNTPMVSNPVVNNNNNSRTPRTHLGVLLKKKQEQASERRQIHEMVSSEPVQKYERTKSGNLLPFGTPRMLKHEIPSMKDHYYRDKLLKSERDRIFKQNIKMRRFMNTFEKECVPAKFPSLAHRSSLGSDSNKNGSKRKSIGNFLFKVHDKEQDVEYDKKIVPGVSTTSLRLLKNCRYLRQYKPITENERVTSYIDRETSWKMKTNASYTDTYIANVRLQLF